MSNCAVLLINHCADNFDQKRNSLGRMTVPSLGPSWDFNIDEKIEIAKRGEIRELAVVSSPKVLSETKGWFRIETDGFLWITKEGVEYF